MLRSSGWRVLSVAGAIACAAAPAHSQCEPVWSGLGGHDGMGTYSLAVHDEDGPGRLAPALFVGNGFSHILTIARWDGWRATPVGDGPHDSFLGVHTLLSLPEPIGMLPAGLYAGGGIEMLGGVPVKNLARWLPPQWHEVGGGVSAGLVFALAMFDEDGAGPRPPSLFVGGQFESAGGVPVGGLAKWDGSQWTDVGGGLRHRFGPGRVNVNAMTIYDDGRGPALYAAGNFDSAGGAPAYNIARWDGVSWEPVGPASTVRLNRCTSLTRTVKVQSGPPSSPVVSSARYAAVIRGACAASGAGTAPSGALLVAR